MTFSQPSRSKSLCFICSGIQGITFSCNSRLESLLSYLLRGPRHDIFTPLSLIALTFSLCSRVQWHDMFTPLSLKIVTCSSCSRVQGMTLSHYSRSKPLLFHSAQGPRHDIFTPLSLKALTFSLCSRVQGMPFCYLSRLESLRFHSAQGSKACHYATGLA